MITNTTTASLQADLQHKLNNKTKPPGSLGLLEDIALQVGMIQETTSPMIAQPYMVIFAGDHGIAKTGLVNPYPQAVTAQMVLNFLHGGAAINVFCRQHHITLQVVDAGVNFDLIPASTQLRVKDGDIFINAKMEYGTGNYLEGPAMSEAAVLEAIEKGKAIVKTIADRGTNCIGFGEMGIGNTSSASLIMSAVTGIPIAECVGRGTGANNEQLQIKINTLEQVYAFHQLQQFQDQPIRLLAAVGGFEIAMMTGAYVQAAEQKMVIVVDGFIATASVAAGEAALSLHPAKLHLCAYEW